jgi:hypothetical protein
MTESQPITKKLQQLEEYITSLVESLQRGEIPMGLRPVRSVFDRILVEELPQLQLPPQKFCDLYNDIPNVLDAYAIEVTLNADSYGQNNAQQIIFDRLNNGNYWIIAIAAKPLHYWLVPNPTRRVDLTRLNSLPFVFDWPDQKNTTKQDTFKLIEPAVVIALPTAPLSWKLLIRGSISTFLNGDARAHQRAFRSIPALNSEEIDGIVNYLRTELTGSIMIELLSLNSKIKSVEDNQLEKNGELLSKYSAINKELQTIKVAIVDTGSFLGQQNLVNQQLSDKSQKAEKTIGEVEQKINKLLREKQQQIDEINVIKSLFNRLNQTGVNNDDQTIRKAVQNINSFLEQQNSVNQSVNAHIQSIEKKSENQEREIQELMRENQNSVNQSISEYIQSIENKSESHECKIQELMKENQKQDREIQILQSVLSSQNVQQTNSAKDLSTKNTSDLTFTPEELDWLQDYNSVFLDVPSSLRDRVNVSINEETFTRLRHDCNESNIAFEPDRKGNYWVIARGRHHYIVPSKQRRMITQIYTVTKAIYKCDGYSESYKDFRLIKPALVSKESINCWKLNQQGILEFT